MPQQRNYAAFSDSPVREGRQNVSLLNGRRLREQIAGLGHERSRYWPVEVCLAAGFIWKRIEDSES